MSRPMSSAGHLVSYTQARPTSRIARPRPQRPQAGCLRAGPSCRPNDLDVLPWTPVCHTARRGPQTSNDTTMMPWGPAAGRRSASPGSGRRLTVSLARSIPGGSRRSFGFGVGRPGGRPRTRPSCGTRRRRIGASGRRLSPAICQLQPSELPQLLHL